MNKKNKGFTLAEVLATIAIISVITLIATITYTKVRKDILEREYKNLESLIEIAGVRYSSKTGILGFFVQDLINEGYLDPDDDNKIRDPRDNSILNGHIVRIKIDNEKNYKAELLPADNTANDGCRTSALDPYINDIVLSVKIHGTDINYLSATSESQLGKKSTTASDNIYKNINIVLDQGNRWTKKQLDLTADIKTNSTYLKDLDNATYIWNKNEDTATTTGSYTTDIERYFNGNYYLDVYTKSGEHYQSKFLFKFDNEKPIIYDEKTKYADPMEEFQWSTEKTLLVYASDGNGVGLDRLYGGTRPCDDMLKDPDMGDPATPNSMVHTVHVNDVESGLYGENGMINLCAVDKLGNLAEPGEFLIRMEDVIPPHCDHSVGEHDEYQYASRTVEQYCYDNNYINGVLVIGSGCTQDMYSDTWSTTTTIGYITLTDNVGHHTDCAENVYVDRTPPVCAYTSGEGSTDNWTQSSRTITQYCRDDHVGCKQNSYTKSWTRPEGEYLETDTITIYDKVPKCSQTSVTSSNCANYESIKDTAENLTNYNNSTVCTEGVYIDHVAPVPEQRGHFYIAGNRGKVYCTDAQSGVDYFEATHTTNGNIKKYNNDGSKLKFEMNGTNTTHVLDTTCRDKVGNEAEKSFNFVWTSTGLWTLSDQEMTHYIAGSFIQHDFTPINSLDDSGTCYLEPMRAPNYGTCIDNSYDCYVLDRSCGAGTNSGQWDTCCLTGSDPYFGCKVAANSTIEFDNLYTYDNTVETWSLADRYITYQGIKYYVPDESSKEYIDDVPYFKRGSQCILYNCYMDEAGNHGTPNMYVCGNFRE